MKDKIAISKANGEVCIVIPLYRHHYDETLGKLEGYTISLTKDEPLAYVIDAGPAFGEPQLCNAKTADKYLEFVGDL